MPLQRVGWLYRWCLTATGQEYYGITLYPEVRYRAYLARASLDRNPLGILYALARYGLDAFVFERRRRAPLAELPDLEREAIARAGSLAPNGFNLNAGGCHHVRGGYSFEYEGEVYESGLQLALAFGLEPATLYYRVASGWTLPQTIGIDHRKHHRAIEICHPDGTVYASGRRGGLATGQSPWKIQYWRVKGASDAQVLGLEPVPAKDGRRQVVHVHGTAYGHMTAACKALGLKPRHVSHYKWLINKGRSAAGLSALSSAEVLERLVRADGSRAPASRERFLQLPDGREMNATAAARELGLNPATVLARLRRGYTPGQALRPDPRPRTS